MSAGIERWIGAGRTPALVISECQNGLINPEFATAMSGLAEQAVKRQIVQHISFLADSFRRAGLPVAHATIEPHADWHGYDVSSPLAAHTKREDLFKRGNPHSAIHPGLTPQPGDLLFPRYTAMTSFFRSGLGAALRERDVDTVVLAGISTNIAIPGTTVEAVNRGYSVVIAQDCTAATNSAVHELMFAEILPALAAISSAAEIAAIIDSRPPRHRAGG